MNSSLSPSPVCSVDLSITSRVDLPTAIAAEDPSRLHAREVGPAHASGRPNVESGCDRTADELGRETVRAQRHLFPPRHERQPAACSAGPAQHYRGARRGHRLAIGTVPGLPGRLAGPAQ